MLYYKFISDGIYTKQLQVSAAMIHGHVYRLSSR